jgi:hypothetical protein
VRQEQYSRVRDAHPGNNREFLRWVMSHMRPHRRARIVVRAVAHKRGSLRLAAFLARLRLRCLRQVLALLALPLREPVPGPPLASDLRPAGDLSPPMPVLLSRTVLTAAPPRLPAPVLAGAAA